MVKQKAIYFRASPELAIGVKEYASKKGVTTSAAVANLVEVGIELADKRHVIEELEKALEEGKRARGLAEEDTRRLHSELQRVQDESARNMRMLQNSYNGLLGHLRVTDLATCPSCHQVLSAYDVIIQKRCPHCNIGISLGSVLDSQRPGETIRDLLAVIGGIATFAVVANALSSRDSV